MKKIIYIILFLVSTTAFTQNRINYSQYMLNQGVFNSAYFDSQNQMSGSVFYRNQWTGMEGSPETKSLVLAYNLGNKHGLNMNVYQDDITVFSDLKLGLGYNYRINLSRSSVLSFGINSDYGFYSAK